MGLRNEGMSLNPRIVVTVSYIVSPMQGRPLVACGPHKRVSLCVCCDPFESAVEAGVIEAFSRLRGLALAAVKHFRHNVIDARRVDSGDVSVAVDDEKGRHFCRMARLHPEPVFLAC